MAAKAIAGIEITSLSPYMYSMLLLSSLVLDRNGSHSPYHSIPQSIARWRSSGLSLFVVLRSDFFW